MGDITLTTNVTLNGGTVEVTVSEGDADAAADDFTTAHKITQSVADGIQSYTLSGFDFQSDDKTHWADISLSTSDTAQTPQVDSIEFGKTFTYTGVEVPGAAAATRESAGPYPGVSLPAARYALFGVPEPPAVGWRARIQPARSEAHTITNVAEPQVDLDHSQMSSFSATVPYSEQLIEEAGATADLYYRSELRDHFIARMTYEEFSGAGGGAGNDGAATMQISGRGALAALDRGTTAALYDQVTAADAIRDFTSAETDLSWSVIGPDEEPVDGERLAFAQADSAADDPTNNPSPFEALATNDREHPVGEELPLFINETGLTAHPTSYFFEGEDSDDGSDGTVVSAGGASGGQALDLAAADDGATWTTDIGWKLGPARMRDGVLRDPAARVALRVSNPGGSAADIELRAGGEQVDTKQIAAGAALDWYRPAAFGKPLGPGEVTVEVSKTNDGGTARIDAVVIYDDTFSYNFADTVDSNGALAGPEPYPERVGGLFEGVAADAMIDTAQFSFEFDHGAPEAQMGANINHLKALDGDIDRTHAQDYYPADGTSGTITGVLSGFDPLTRFRPVVQLGSYADPNKTTSPTTATEIQTLTRLEVSYDGRRQPVFNAQTFEGSRLEIIQQMHEAAGLRFTYQHGHHPEGADIDVESYPTGHVYPGPDGAGSWVVEDHTRSGSIKGYANRVVVEGARRGSGGVTGDAETGHELRERIREQYRDRQAGSGAFVRAVVEDEDEIQARADALGVPYEQAVIEHTITDRALLTHTDCLSRGRGALPKLLANDAAGGDVTIGPKLVLPGYAYAVSELGAGEGEEIALESVSISESPGDASAKLSFSRTAGFVDALAQALRRGR